VIAMQTSSHLVRRARGLSSLSSLSRALALATLVLASALASALAGCGGGQYSTSTQRFGGAERGEANGRMFDYVAMSADGDQWEVRIRGNSMWLAYSLEDKAESFKPVVISSAEEAKVWKLVDVIDLPSRRRGRIDEANGSVLLRLREPGDEEHDIYSVYFSREAENEKVKSLAKYLTTLAKKYYNEKPLL
jgi:hypothetical protein